MNEKNIEDNKLEICSLHPRTGYESDGYCKPVDGDHGEHLVCAVMDKKFLDYTKKQGNDLSSVVKPGQKWCLCQNRYYEAFIAGKAPFVEKQSTHKSVKRKIQNAITKNKGGKITRKKRQQFLYNPNDPKKSFDVYIDKDPSDTIPIKYTTVQDVKNTIKKLERLYKTGKYSHKRIWQVGMIMKVRLEAMLKHKKTRYPNAKNVKERFHLANKYFLFLRSRTKKHEKERKQMIFLFNS